MQISWTAKFLFIIVKYLFDRRLNGLMVDFESDKKNC